MTLLTSIANAAITANTAGLSVRRLRQVLQQGSSLPGAINQMAPVSDPQQQIAATACSFNNTARIVEGAITDTTAIANCYRVQFENLAAIRPCVLLTQSSISANGPRSLATLQPGTRVTVVLNPMLPWGLIIGVSPPTGTTAKLAIEQILTGSTRARVDEAHKHPIKTHAGGHIPNWLAGRPFDATTAGEQGWIAETGMRIFIDSFMAMFGVDEATMLTCFYHDQLMRMASYNWQHWTAGMEREGFDDQGEYNDVTGFTPYPWEQLGLFERGDPRRNVDPEAWQLTESHYSNWEPKDDYQMPWHRERHYHGYLGQGGKLIVTAAPTEAGEYASYAGGKGDVGAEYPSLLDISHGLDGRYLLSSAKGIAIVKRCGGIVPSRLRRAEQPLESSDGEGTEGDSPANYKHAGIAGEGPEHKITGDIAADGEDPQFQRALGVMDFHAYMFNYAGVHPFFYHANDWKLHEEGSLKWTDGTSFNFEDMDFASLANSMYLQPPEPIKLKIDHRYGEQDFYQTESGIQLLDDGGIVIYDGYGGEIRMTGGSVFISAPGDIWTKAGRNCNVWAGWDYIMRAKNSSDMTVSDKDMRFKAENNLQMLAGNSGLGNVLIESRGSTSGYDFSRLGEDVVAGGIILKAGNSDIVSLAKNIYLRTGGGEMGSGTITLDADKGDQDIVMHAARINEYVQDGVFHFFGTEGSVDQANEFSRWFCTIGTAMGVDGGIYVNGQAIIKDWIFSVNEHIVTKRGGEWDGRVLPLTGRSESQAESVLEDIQSRATKALPDAAEEQYQYFLDQLWYGTQRPGSDDVITDAEFSLRELEHYRTDDFRLYEDRWQQLARLAGQAPNMWQEKAVLSQRRELYPYPGKANFTQDTYYEQDLEMYTVSGGKGHSKDRGTQPELAEAYASPKFGEATSKSLNNNYPVIR